MSDITAVVLTTGEETTQRAIQSVQEQSIPPVELVLIENVVPFYRALNVGASRVTTDFFVQVDADMILDADCFGALRRCMTTGVGIVAGFLRDPMIGRTCCVKLFRRACFDRVQLNDSTSADTDFGDDILRFGWSTVYALRFEACADMRLWHTFGEHRPDYSPGYTFSKYLVEGRRYRYRKNPGGLRWYLSELENSNHSAALIAQVAMAHGIFLEEEGDLQGVYSPTEESRFLEEFLAGEGSHDVGDLEALLSASPRPREIFRQTYGLAIELRRHNASGPFRECLDLLRRSRHPHAWIGKIGLCHGLFFESYSQARFGHDYRLFSELLPGESLAGILRAKHRGCVRLVRDAARSLFE